jgi:asparagine synthase (glutamine-hydrolysing)
MCGIVGAWREGCDLSGPVARAREQLRHRGPDDIGLWTDSAAGIALGHTRLAVLDLSQAGHQPMSSPDGRFHMVYNGEIYNHGELRERLHVSVWRGHSDSETLLAAFSAWGLERTLKACVGMFALALYDSVERKLYLARDRFGEKPLYYGYAGGAFVFASQLRALRALPGFDHTIDRTALSQFLRLSQVPAPRSIYCQIRKLPMGTHLELTARALPSHALPDPQTYWSAAEVALAGDREPLELSDTEALEGLEQTLGTAVRGQMIADVPLGAFLSGGIDSSAIVALMQANSTRPARTFSIGFGAADFDESRYAREVARHLGTDHTELIARAEDLLALVARMPQVYDEPFGDSSQLPTCLVAALARPHVTVALSGDGGDELFGGYNRHRQVHEIWPRLARLPQSVRKGLAQTLLAVPAELWNGFAAAHRRAAPGSRRFRRLSEKLQRIAEVIPSADELELYSNLVSAPWPSPPLIEEGNLQPLGAALPPLSTAAQRMMLADLLGYLPNDILVKVDRATMAVGLESRMPLLDHRVFEYASRLPLRMKIREGKGKWLLRQLLYRHIPRALVDRPKMGFAVPLAEWLRGPFRSWAEELLQRCDLEHAGLEPDAIRQLWSEHLAGKRHWQYQLWNVLMFRTWAAEQQRSVASRASVLPEARAVLR